MNNSLKKHKFINYINKFPDTNVLVIGDLMLDRFVYGTVSRISPEAPVPVVEVIKELDLPGGAGNVANNISSLNAQVYLAGVVGNDSTGEKFKADLRAKKINTEGIFTDLNRPTTIKTRIIAQHQQMVRYDKENKNQLDLKLTLQFIDYLKQLIPQMKAVILSDYGKGVIKPDVLKTTISLCNKLNIPVTVDPKIEHFLRYKKVTCITPNMKEAVEGMRMHSAPKTEKQVEELGNKILRSLNSESLIITRGEKGMSVFEKGKLPIHIPTRAIEVFDVTGAGDTVIAVLSLCLAVGCSIPASAEISNYAAGIVVGKLGTATVTILELKEAVNK